MKRILVEKGTFAPAGTDALEADADRGVENDGDGGYSHSMRQIDLRHKCFSATGREGEAGVWKGFEECNLCYYPSAALFRIEVAAIDDHAASLQHDRLGCCEAFWP